MKILMGMSGGVDSTYAARLLLEQGHDVEGAVLQMHEYTEIGEAEESARALGISLRVIDCRSAFEDIVIKDFCGEYCKGRTPNPCIICNERVKLRFLFDAAMRDGFSHIATGHYAGVTEENGRYAITAATDLGKDQSYMLYRLPQDILARLLLPLGALTKKEIVKQARENALLAAEREESQEICFVRGEGYADYIERRIGKTKGGCFVDEDGRALGAHKGIIHYTVGQRKGLGVSAPTRLFVREIDVETGNIVLAPQRGSVSRIYLSSVVFMGCAEADLSLPAHLHVRLRYSAPLTEACVRFENGRWLAELSEPPCAVTPGQSAVFYRDGCIAFGGIIEKTV